MSGLFPKNDIATLGMRAVRGFFPGRMRLTPYFEGDDLRRHGPEIQCPALGNICPPFKGSTSLPENVFGKRVIHLGSLDASDQASLPRFGVPDPAQLEPVYQMRRLVN